MSSHLVTLRHVGGALVWGVAYLDANQLAFVEGGDNLRRLGIALLVCGLTACTGANQKPGPDAGPDTSSPAAVETPVIAPGTGLYSTPQTVTITTATAGGEIHFTEDGTTPTAQSPVYSTALTVAATETVKAVATLAGALDSGVATATITIELPAPDLVINEVGNAVYSNLASAIEIYNGTAGPKDLANYQLRTTARTVPKNGNNYVDAGKQTFTLPSLVLPVHGYAVIRGKVNEDYVSGGATLYVDDGASNIPWYGKDGFVELLDDKGATADFVRFGSDATAPTTADFKYTGAAPGFIADDSHLGSSINRDLKHTNKHDGAEWTTRAWMTLGGPNDVTTDAASDGDAIPDSAKQKGGTFAGMPLYDWGARPGQKDIFIHLDYMDRTQDPTDAAGDEAMVPNKKALDHVVAVFAAKGYVVHFDVGDLFSSTKGDAANYNLDGRSHKVPWALSLTIGLYANYANANEYKVKYMPLEKGRAFFYMLFGSSQNANGGAGSSGLANLPGSTSIVTFGRYYIKSPRLINYQASTILHEFGHNLGLRHGGDENLNHKLNYFSIMNYLYQLKGLPTIGTDDDTRYYAQAKAQQGSLAFHDDRTIWSNWVASPDSNPDTFLINYSDGTGKDIDPAAMNDTTGIGRPNAMAIDFDITNSTTKTSYPFDVMDFITGTPEANPLHDFDDWGKINLVFQRTIKGFDLGAGPERGPVTSARELFIRPSTHLSGPCASP